MKIERKTTFVVAGIEFQNLKTAQFFQRAIRLHTQDLYPVLGINALNEAEMLLRGWYNTLGVTETQVDKEALVEAVMGLQMPKPARKPTPKKKKAQALAGDPQTKEFWDEHHTKNQFLEPAPNEHEELCDALDTTFALVSEPHEKLNPPEEPPQHPYW